MINDTNIKSLGEAEIRSIYRNDFYCSDTKEYYENGRYTDLVEVIDNFLNENLGGNDV